ncbi:tRNA endonuclease ANKZF1 isoform X3 [Melanerpes formicivorus]|uniref:tRNA endonuclease ANKZF1 isoform X3 n=1 Tax=Melanerpes formicivorus TaxID=211600 RepID=UPI00358F9BBC
MPTPEIISVFDAAQDPLFLHGLTLVTGVAADATEPAPVNHDKFLATSREEKVYRVPEVPERMCCLTCRQVFGSREEQTEHYHLDWHRFNLKQRLLGRQTLPVEVFEEKTRTGDVSSISGSDSESSDTGSESESLPSASFSPKRLSVPRSHKVLLRNAKGQLISAYRCVVGTKEGVSEEPAELMKSLQSLNTSTCWVVLMMGGGHFAGAVFRGPEMQEHKTFHRYTVRARQGTAQGLRDAQSPGSAPRSAGASLRRYNEAALLKVGLDHSTGLLAGRSFSGCLHGVVTCCCWRAWVGCELWKRVKTQLSLLYPGFVSATDLCVPTRCAQVPMVLHLTPQDIQDLLAAWAQHLKEAQRIFLRAPRHNRALLFGGRNPPLTQSDPRVCHIPLSTRRATLREVLRVHTVLASLQVYGKDTPVEDITGSPRKSWQKRQQKVQMDPVQKDKSGPVLSPASAPEEEQEEEESPEEKLETVEMTLGTLHLQEFKVVPKRNCKRRKRNKKVEKGPHAEEMQLHGQPGPEQVIELQEEAAGQPLPWGNEGDPQTQLRNALFTACKTGDVGMLSHLLGVPESDGLLVDSEDREGTQPLNTARSLLNQPMDEGGCTLLHVAARAGKANAVCLLLKAGADPALRDRQDRTPYCVSADKVTRNAFRKFMVDHPDKYDYKRAKVPGPLTQEMEAKKLEKKRAQKAQRKQREQAQQEEQQRLEQEQKEKQWFAALSDREKVRPCMGKGIQPNKGSADVGCGHSSSQGLLGLSCLCVLQRALAAERRLAAQLQDTSTTLTNIRFGRSQPSQC